MATLAGVVIGFVLNWIRDARAEHSRVVASRRRFAAALLAEISALRERYSEIVVEPLEKWRENKRLEIGGSIRATNLFVVYDGNTDKLGLFAKADAEAIVRGYTLAKSHAESLNLFGETIGNLFAQVTTFRAIGNHGAVNSVEISIMGITNASVPKLKKESADVLGATEAAVSALKKYA